MKIEKYSNCTIAENKNICILQNDFNFYKIDSIQKSTYVESPILSSFLINDNIICFVISAITIILSFIIYFSFSDYKLVDENYIIATVVLLLNIPIHELGHVMTLKLFYKESKIRVGFKWFFIFPAFYVDTSYSYFLPKYKKITVYLAGTLFNAIFILLLFMFSADLLKYCNILIANMFVNFLPIIKSDGYYSIITMFEKYTYYKGKKREYIEDFVRGIFMWLFMLALSYLF